jgi:hypothetical protein
MEDTRRNHHLLHSALYEVYPAVLRYLIAVLKQSAAQRETKSKYFASKDESGNLETTLTKEPRSLKYPKWESTTPQLRLKLEIPTRNFFAPLGSIENETDHGEEADDTTGRQQHQESSNHIGGPPALVLTSQVNLKQLQRQL